MRLSRVRVVVGLVTLLMASDLGCSRRPARKRNETKESLGRRAASPRAMVAGTSRVVILAARGKIDQAMSAAFVGVLKTAAPTDLIIVDVNTVGGRVDSATQIRDALLATKAQTIAFINRRAIGAGALIALACHLIAVAPGTILGAAVLPDPPLAPAPPPSGKVLSYVKKLMRSTAEARGRRGDLAEAMVDARIAIRDVPHRVKRPIAGLEKGKLLTLTGEEAIALRMAELRAEDSEDLLRQLRLSHVPKTRGKN